MNGEKVSWLAFSCTHSPLHDSDAIDWALGEAEDRQPDVLIHLGDFLEADAASKWPSEYDWTLADEFGDADTILSLFRGVTPNARHILLEGNHDANVLEINRIDPKLRGLVDYRKHIKEIADGHWEMPCRYIYNRNKGVFRIGQVTFAHGFEANQSPDEYQSYTLGLPYGLFVGGHTHRPQPVTQCMRTKAIPLPYWYANSGCLRDIDNVPYMTRKRRHQWGQALVAGESKPWRYEQSLMPQDKAWEAETLIRRMY